jgi:hypothetical protein
MSLEEAKINGIVPVATWSGSAARKAYATLGSAASYICVVTAKVQTLKLYCALDNHIRGALDLLEA